MLGKVASQTQRDPAEELGRGLFPGGGGFLKAQLECCCQKEEEWVLDKEQPVGKRFVECP